VEALIGRANECARSIESGIKSEFDGIPYVPELFAGVMAGILVGSEKYRIEAGCRETIKKDDDDREAAEKLQKGYPEYSDTAFRIGLAAGTGIDMSSSNSADTLLKEMREQKQAAEAEQGGE
jgi:hypothetical protein